MTCGWRISSKRLSGRIRQGSATLADTWIADTLIGELNYRDMSIDAVDPAAFTGLLGLLREGVITDNSGIEVLRVMLDQHLNNQPCEKPLAIVDRLNLRKVSVTIPWMARSPRPCES